MLLRQSTTVTIKLGPFVDATDGVTEETGLGAIAVEVAKNGAAFAARNSATAAAHDAEGWYNVELDGTDTNTLGRLRVKSHDSATHLPVWQDFMVIEQNAYDAIVAGSADLQVAVVSGGIAAAAFAANAVNAAALATDAVQEIVNAVLDEPQSSHIAGGSIGLSISEAAGGPIPRNTAITLQFVMKDDNDNPVPAATFTASQYSLDGAGTWTPLTNSPVAIGSGGYYIDLVAAETNGGSGILRFDASDANTTFLLFRTHA